MGEKGGASAHAKPEGRREQEAVDLRDVLDGISEGYALFDANFTVIDVNAETLRLEARSRDDIVGRSHWDLYPGTEHSPLGLLYKKAMIDRIAVNLEHSHEWEDGRVSWLDMRAFPVGNDKLAVFFRDVTDRKLAEQKFKESERRIRAALQVVADVVWTNDAHGRMTEEQPGWAALTGQTVEEYKGYGWTNAVHPDDAQPTLEAWEKAVAAKSLFACEHRVRRYDGTWRSFSIRAAPVFDDSGQVLEWVGVHTDITDLRESEVRFRQLTENISAVFYVRELDEARISYVSPAYEQIWERSAQELYADDMAAMRPIHPADRHLVEAAVANHLRGESTEVRYRLLRADGSVRHIHDRAFVTLNPNGGTRRVVGIAEDVTVTTEARLQLARNAETFKTLVRNNPFGIYVVDGEFKLSEISAGAASVFATIDPLIGRDFEEILRILWKEPFASEAVDRFKSTLATGETHVNHSTVEPRANIDSTDAYDWRIDRIMLPDGSYGVVCYFYDLSERIALESDLRLAMADKDLLLREIDHRVRNSLSMVSSLLAMQGSSAHSDDVRRALSVASARIQAVARIHERLYKGANIGVVEFATYLEEICEDLRNSFQHEGSTLTMKTTPVDLPVDRAIPLGLIANELVTNAFKHCRRLNAAVQVELSCDDCGIHISVSDNGDGVPTDFSPTSKQGLGMRVIASLTRQLGGTLDLLAPGGPATFRVNIK